MENGERTDEYTGKPDGPIPSPESAVAPMEELSKHAPTRSELQNIFETLALLQTDYFELQSQGLRVVVKANNGRLYCAVELPGHPFGFQDGHITLDGRPVVSGE